AFYHCSNNENEILIRPLQSFLRFLLIFFPFFPSPYRHVFYHYNNNENEIPIHLLRSFLKLLLILFLVFINFNFTSIVISHLISHPFIIINSILAYFIDNYHNLVYIAL